MQFSYLFLPPFQEKIGCRRQSLGTNCAEFAEILSDTCHSGILFTFYGVARSLGSILCHMFPRENTLPMLPRKHMVAYNPLLWLGNYTYPGKYSWLFRWYSKGLNLILVEEWDNVQYDGLTSNVWSILCLIGGRRPGRGGGVAHELILWSTGGPGGSRGPAGSCSCFLPPWLLWLLLYTVCTLSSCTRYSTLRGEGDNVIREAILLLISWLSFWHCWYFQSLWPCPAAAHQKV